MSGVQIDHDPVVCVGRAREQGFGPFPPKFACKLYTGVGTARVLFVRKKWLFLHSQVNHRVAGLGAGAPGGGGGGGGGKNGAPKIFGGAGGGAGGGGGGTYGCNQQAPQIIVTATTFTIPALGGYRRYYPAHIACIDGVVCVKSGVVQETCVSCMRTVM